MSSNPGHEDYLSPRSAPRKPPALPKPYAASKSEKDQQATAGAANESKISFCEFIHVYRSINTMFFGGGGGVGCGAVLFKAILKILA